MTIRCKHCQLSIVQAGLGYRHAEGMQQGKLRCAMNPYGFHAEPDWIVCCDDPANPCNGARGMIAIPR